MRWPKSSLLLVVVSLLINQASTDLTTDRFDVLSSGSCGTAKTAWNNWYVYDSGQLASAFQQAINAALYSTYESGQRGRDATVARRLFTAYFGIQFQDADQITLKQTPTAAYKAHWTQIQSVITKLTGFLNSGSLAGPGLSGGTAKPWLGCSGTMFQKFDWNDQVLEYVPSAQATTSNPYKLYGVYDNGVAVAINSVYNQKAGLNPYLLLEKAYYGEYVASSADICDGVYAWTSPGRPVYSGALSGSGRILTYMATEPGVTVCDLSYTSTVTTAAGTTITYPLALFEVTGQNPTANPPVQIADVMDRGSSSIFHELTHLVTDWESSATGQLTVPAGKVTDICYPVNDIMSLAKGTFVKNGATYTSYQSTLNAESYTLFAFSWWYYQQTWTYTTAAGTTVTANPASFFEGGLLREWNVY